MTAPKTFGQIAREANANRGSDDWESLSSYHKDTWERIAAAVAKAGRDRICAWLGSRSRNISCMDVAAAAITHEYARGVK